MRPLLFAPLLLGPFLLVARPAFAQSVFTWEQGQPPVQMAPTASHICLLTRVAGSFRGLGERVELTANAKNWVLRGTSQQDGVGATARCFPKSMFSPNGLFAAPPANDARVDETSRGCLQTSFAGFPGDSITVIAGMSGDFRGGGEFVQVDQAHITGAVNKFFWQSCRDGNALDARAVSFRFGTPVADQLVTLVGRDGARGTVNTVPQTDAAPHSARKLARLADGVCYFTHIGGAFNGGGESVEILPNGDHWRLATASKSGDGTFASARCVAFKQ